MDLGLKGRTAIVCASSRGLGRGCAEALAREGVRVIINGVDQERLARVASEIADATGAEIIPVAGDVSLAATQDALLEAAPEPDILVNNNGGPPLKDFRELDRAAIAEGVVQNMITPIELIQRVIDGMTTRKFGRIVNITSSSVKAPIVGLDLSSGARAGLTAFLAGVCRTVAADNVTVNGILPGRFDTDRLRGNISRTAERMGTSLDDARTASTSQVPAKRFGTADEFGDLCAYLCSAQAGYITGQNVLIDGGLVNTSF
ncbi:MAG: SDR family oxidoreductase [Pseudomonadota bacterium]